MPVRGGYGALSKYEGHEPRLDKRKIRRRHGVAISPGISKGKKGKTYTPDSRTPHGASAATAQTARQQRKHVRPRHMTSCCTSLASYFHSTHMINYSIIKYKKHNANPASAAIKCDCDKCRPSTVINHIFAEKHLPSSFRKDGSPGAYSSQISEIASEKRQRAKVGAEIFMSTGIASNYMRCSIVSPYHYASGTRPKPLPHAAPYGRAAISSVGNVREKRWLMLPYCIDNALRHHLHLQRQHRHRRTAPARTFPELFRLTAAAALGFRSLPRQSNIAACQQQHRAAKAPKHRLAADRRRT